MPIKRLTLLTIFLLFGSLASQGQSIIQFERLIKKNTKKAGKASVKKKIEKSYTELQLTHIYTLTKELSNPEFPPNREALKAASGYSLAKALIKKLYGTSPTLKGENQMLQKAGLELDNYYSSGLRLMSEENQTSKIVALSNLKFVQALDPNYKEVEKTVNSLKDQISYNVLIKYDLEGFEELEPVMFQLNTVLVNDIKAFGGTKVDYYFENIANPNMEFAYTITLDFEFIDVPQVTTRIDQKTYHKNQGRVSIKAQVDKEVFERNIRASGNALIFSRVYGEEYRSEPFNIRIKKKTFNSQINGNQDAIDAINLRRISQEKSSQSNHEKISDKEFRDKIFNILRRQIQEIESYL
ncbi:hypothetical protein [Roseivirga sp. E12]|uniref:hypothetical protein n=1 Tax=Roseivirga sp. E12 TaxID=2819237 RepID=UPI001ABC5A49|nr:hypothetical protein [Roseivirga sp. E12]MBO3700363.1 hypothetical protein [Roseivirga sp. E12]